MEIEQAAAVAGMSEAATGGQAGVATRLRGRRRDAGPDREVGAGEVGPQRALLVRERQEVQALPRRQLRAR